MSVGIIVHRPPIDEAEWREDIKMADVVRVVGTTEFWWFLVFLIDHHAVLFRLKYSEHISLIETQPEIIRKMRKNFEPPCSNRW